MGPQFLIEYWDRVRGGTTATLDKFDEDELGWTPVQGGYSIREICLHIAHEEEIEINYGAAGARPDLPEAFSAGDYPSKASIHALWLGIRARTMEYLRSLTSESIATPVELAWGETARPLDVILHVIEHEIHHRGELSLGLGLLGREGLDA